MTAMQHVEARLFAAPLDAGPLDAGLLDKGPVNAGRQGPGVAFDRTRLAVAGTA